MHHGAMGSTDVEVHSAGKLGGAAGGEKRAIREMPGGKLWSKCLGAFVPIPERDFSCCGPLEKLDPPAEDRT